MSFIQLGLWSDCLNNCRFCYLDKKERHKTTPTENKRNRILKAAEFAESSSAQRIGFIGGEFFCGQLKGCEDEWMYLLDTLARKDSEVLFTANLIGKQYFLGETLDGLDNDVNICTSFDLKGRFHSEAARASWFENVEGLHERNVSVVCTCILTQDFLEWDYDLPDWLEINFSNPTLSTRWYSHVDKDRYHELLLRDNHFFSLPKRKTAIGWMKNHPNFVRNYVNYCGSHPNNIYTFDVDDNLKEFSFDFTTSTKYNDPVCGHPYNARCYADSDKCMMCDAKLIAGTFDDLP